MHPFFSLLAAVVVLAPVAARAQDIARLRSASELLVEPGGRALATLRPGAELARGPARGGWVSATLEGWVDSTLVRRAARPPWALIVRAPGGLMLRQAPAAGGTALAQLPNGMGLEVVRRQGAWVRVRRSGWVPSRALDAPAARQAAAPASRTAAPVAASPAATAPAAATAATTEAPPPEGAFVPARDAALRSAPGGRTLASLPQGEATMLPLARDGGWVKVRIEGWVPESDVMPADTALRSTLTAADLRADPEGTRGRMVRWDVEFLALRTADALRRDLAEGERFMLVRGPGAETSLLYIAVPPSLVRDAEALPELARLTIVARVRTGRSSPSGVPVLDLQTLARR